MRLRLTAIPWFVALFLTGALFDVLCAQVPGLPSSHTKDEVRAMFPGQTRDLWINYLSGTLAGSYNIDMIIGTDGHTCRGLYTLRSSGVTFLFEGEEQDNQLRLVEYTQEYRATGFMSGNYDGNSFRGIWENRDHNLSFEMDLHLVSSFHEYVPQRCRQDFWQRIYEGTISGQDTAVKLSREGRTVTMRIDENGKQYIGLEPLADARTETIHIDASGSVLDNKWLLADTTNFSKIDLVRLTGEEYEVIGTLRQKATLVFECFEYADINSMMECSVPKAENRKFNAWMDKQLKTWLDNSLKKIKDHDATVFGTKDRWINTASGWVETDYFSGSLVSGHIYLQSNWSKKTDKISFIFDLNEGRLLTLQDLFVGEFRADSYFKTVVSDMKKTKEWKPAVKKWADTQEFTHVSLTDEGISFTTPYNTVYGEKEILIPYDTVRQYFKRKEFLRR